MKLKPIRNALLLLFLFVWAFPANAQLTFGYLSADQITGTALNANDRSAVILIHGWNPGGISDMFAAGDFLQLKNALSTRLNGSGAKLLLFHWETDASTGPATEGLSGLYGEGFYNASSAASNAFIVGP